MKKAKEKINPIMNNKNIRNIKANDFGASEDENIIKKFLIVSIVIIIVVAIVYGVTELFKNKKEPTDDVVAGEINYDKVSVGMLLNRPYDEYYVLAYGADDSNAVLYSTILTNYMQKSTEEDYVKIYFCDLDNTLNKSYYNVGEDNKSNPKAQNVKELDFGKLTLLQIEKGKITKYIEDLDEIKKILK